MYLVSLVYTSEVVGTLDVRDILDVSRVNNEKQGITGVLLYRHDHVIQCLEGARGAVSETYARIVRDKRHENLVLLDYRTIQARSFSEWSMGYLPESSLSRPVLLKYSGSPVFEPRLLGGEGCLRMLVELQQRVSTA